MPLDLVGQNAQEQVSTPLLQTMMDPYSVHSFRANPSTHSGLIRPPIPIHSVHPSRGLSKQSLRWISHPAAGTLPQNPLEEVAMAKRRLSMRKIEEVLRLKWVHALSNRQIAKSCLISHTTVREYLDRARLAGLSWPLDPTLDHATLENMLFPEKAPPHSN